MVLEKTLESPLVNKETNQSILKKINPEYSLEGLESGLWPLDAKSQLIGEDPDAGRD